MNFPSIFKETFVSIIDIMKGGRKN